MPYARLVAPPVDDDPVRRWIMAVGLSIALAAVVAETLLYAGAFTAFTTIAVLGGIAVVGAVIGLVVERTRARRAAEPSLAATTSE
jgi:hypothetical protein